jgi:FixJ family two-component response regulator
MAGQRRSWIPTVSSKSGRRQSVVGCCVSPGIALARLVHIVDDDAALRRAIKRRLEIAGYEVADYPSGQHLLDNLTGESELGCVLLDVRMPGLSGLQLHDRLRELGSTLPIIFLTGHPDIRTTVQAMKAGAEDFLIKPVASDALLLAVERAVARHEVARDRKAKLETVRDHIARLSRREREVFELVVRGHTNKQAANALGTTERTIKAHRQQVMEKMRVRSIAELVSLAERVGVLGSTFDSRQTT